MSDSRPRFLSNAAIHYQSRDPACWARCRHRHELAALGCPPHITGEAANSLHRQATRSMAAWACQCRLSLRRCAKRMSSAAATLAPATASPAPSSAISTAESSFRYSVSAGVSLGQLDSAQSGSAGQPCCCSLQGATRSGARSQGAWEHAHFDSYQRLCSRLAELPAGCADRGTTAPNRVAHCAGCFHAQPPGFAQTPHKLSICPTSCPPCQAHHCAAASVNCQRNS